MTIEIVDKEGSEIINLDLQSNPFKVGETISLEIYNQNKDFWNVEDLNDTFVVDKIDHYARRGYLLNKTVSNFFCVSVEVTKLKK